ncbi:glycosyl hydrolases family 31-domain-containing protein [Paraphysoderma sedebokerense]|nr:glycosyl hydrolases family 31-domain-containing protein [Paraphysoderma sedebokerense]
MDRFRLCFAVALFVLGLAQVLLSSPVVNDKTEKSCSAYYSVENPQQWPDQSSAFESNPLKFPESRSTHSLNLQNPCSRYSTPYTSAKLFTEQINAHTFHIKISASGAFQVPQSVLSPQSSKSFVVKDTALYKVYYDPSPFAFWVVRKSDDSVIFDTRSYDIVFEKQYLEISTKLPKDANIYGFGETSAKLKRDTQSTDQAIWARDASPEVGKNAYGYHPFYMELRNGKAHGVFLMSTNGMDIVMRPGRLTYKIIGGILDFYFFLGPSPYDVIDQYTQLIGRPHMPPYWSLGFHQCRWGYKNLNEVADVVAKYKEYNIPLEVMWTDIDYMKEYALFTWDPNNFPIPKVKSFLKQLHSNGQKFIVIIDPGIKVDTSDKHYLAGLEQNVYIKDKEGKNFVGKVWPGAVTFPDWFKTNTQKWWSESIENFLDSVDGQIDGLWVDMNELANFCDGYCPLQETPGYQPPAEPYDYPSYKINNAGDRSPLDGHTIPIDLTHGNSNNISELDVHSVYGHMMSISTRNALLNYRPKSRPFVLTRSTYPGTGKYAAHWLGDTFATWDQLALSIPSVMMFQMFGIPFVGADIGGFHKSNVDKEELVRRWIQLGALYPFARDHASFESQYQELYRWKSVAESGRKMLNVRYSLLPYLYTQFHHAHKTGRPIWRPMFFDYPNDPATYDIDTQFFVGPALLASPIVTSNAKSKRTYFPEGIWYDYYSHLPMTPEKVFTAQGKWIGVPAPEDVLPLYIRGGSVIVSQYPGYTTAESRQNDYYITVALDAAGSAVGDVYFDDGESVDTTPFSHIKYTAKERVFTSTGVMNYEGTKSLNLDKVIIIGLTEAVRNVVFNGEAVSEDQWSLKDGVLTIQGLDKVMNTPFKMEF